jgi:hypothetical protein
VSLDTVTGAYEHVPHIPLAAAFPLALPAHSGITGDLFRPGRARRAEMPALQNVPGNENCTEKSTGRHLRAPANRGLTVLRTGRADRD